jgi:uncharacterized protein YoxC
MEFLNEFLPILLYIAGIVLLIVLIILGIKAIKILDNVEDMVEDVQDKIDEFDGAISLLSKTANSFAGISNSIVSGITAAIAKIFSKKMKEEDDIYE